MVSICIGLMLLILPMGTMTISLDELYRESSSLHSQTIAYLNQRNTLDSDAYHATCVKALSATNTLNEKFRLPNIGNIQTNYGSMFEEFILQSKPFMTQMESQAVIPIENLLESCKGVDANPVSLDISLSKCNVKESQLRTILMPKISNNNYLQRLKSVAGLNISDTIVNLLEDWPAIVPVSVRHARVQACPLGLPQVIWNSGSAAINVRIFAKEQGLLLREEFVYGNLTDDSHHPIFLVYQFDGSTAGGEGGEGALALKFKEFALEPGFSAFIPAQFLTSFELRATDSESESAPAGTDTDTGTGTGTAVAGLLRDCLVTAANWQALLRQLAVYSPVSSHFERIGAELASSAWQAQGQAGAAGLGTSMSMWPTEQSVWSRMQTQSLPSVTEESDKEDAVVGSSEVDKSEPEAAAMSVSVSEVPGKRRRGKAKGQAQSAQSQAQTGPTAVDMKDWNALNKWNSLIARLTLAAPSPPAVTAVGRRNVSLSWSSAFLPSEHDMTPFGFNITICKGDFLARATEQVVADVLAGASARLLVDTLQGSELASASDDDDDHGHCHTHLLWRSAGSSSSSHDSAGRLHWRRDAQDVLTFSVTITTQLLPLTAYRCAASTVYGQHASLWTGHVSSFTTERLTVPREVCWHSACLAATADPKNGHQVQLSFPVPGDDGGEPVTAYHVYMRRVIRTEQGHWAGVGVWLAGGIYPPVLAADKESIQLQALHLPANSSLVFKVAAINIIGESSNSSLSNAVKTVAVRENVVSRARSVVYGSSHHKHSPHTHALQNIASSGYLTVRDGQEVVEISDKKFSCWRSEWSANLFDVQAQCSLLCLGCDISGRIAVVVRNGESFSSMALAAQLGGAVALVIVDNGQCAAFDQVCVPGASKERGEGFARLDPAHLWAEIRLPVVLVAREVGEEIKLLCSSSLDHQEL